MLQAPPPFSQRPRLFGEVTASVSFTPEKPRPPHGQCGLPADQDLAWLLVDQQLQRGPPFHSHTRAHPREQPGFTPSVPAATLPTMQCSTREVATEQTLPQRDRHTVYSVTTPVTWHPRRLKQEDPNFEPGLGNSVT